MRGDLVLEMTHPVVAVRCWRSDIGVRDAMDVRELAGTNAHEVAAVDIATMHEREIFIVALYYFFFLIMGVTG